MQAHADKAECIACGRRESESVLLPIRFRSQDRWICSRCFPILIHHPERLAGRLPGAETLTPAQHEDDRGG
jgi:hypothetical protein